MKKSVDKSLYHTKRLIDGMEALGIKISEIQMDRLLDFYEFLVEKNKVMNLTAITDFDEVAERHYLDSAAIVRVCDLNGIGSIVDVGTGAGFPGIPLAILFPDIEFTLLDSLAKRVTFLKEAAEGLKLSNVRVYHGRAEDLAREAIHRDRYDLAVSRAVAALPILTEYCLPYVRVGGKFIAYKSVKTEEEVETSGRAIKELGGELDKIIHERLEGSERDCAFVVIKKIKVTPNKYPRKAGTPKAKPL